MAEETKGNMAGLQWMSDLALSLFRRPIGEFLEEREVILEKDEGGKDPGDNQRVNDLFSVCPEDVHLETSVFAHSARVINCPFHAYTGNRELATA